MKLTAGTITIEWRGVNAEADDPADRYDWNYSADPPIPDELAEAVLHEVWKRV